ncbi:MULTISPECIES: tetratricopeptide repeat protein [Shewanella]|nr:MULTISPECIES: tetratricopeptide repeat protein [Shewanella]MCE9776338.1 tetratricopeptide repeat protein [Shewanella algae]WKC41576.1 tetratricopeptide repeat protein [Shewanella algae]
MMRKLTLLLGLSLALSTQAATIDEIDAAANQIDIDTLSLYADNSQGYQQAYANYRLAVSANILGQLQTRDQALATAAESLAQPNFNKDGEALALLSAVYGMQITANPSQSATLGKAAGKSLQNARQLAPNSPRVALIGAISSFYTPVEYGGSSDRALQEIERALKLYANPCSDICWGQAEAYTWRGVIQQQLGQSKAASQSWQQALALDPDYAWAGFLLSKQTQQ